MAVVYVVAAFVVLQAADILFPALRLPEWTLSFLAALAILGFPVAVALAWAFDLTTEGVVKTPGREGRDDGALEGGDDSPAARVLVPRRAVWFVLGILVALSGAWFGATRLADETADVTVDEEAAPGLAVLPFRTTGEGLETWGEGMVDLLSRNLDGVGGLRAIDSRTILARWRESVGGDETDLATALEVARRARARWALLGTAVEVGPRVRVTADLHNVASGRRVEGVMAEGPADSLLHLVDRLSVDVARALLARQNPDLTGIRISSITTPSPAALRAFMEGEAQYRRSQFEAALEAYQRAVDLDPGFALAHFRIASALNWASLPGELDARAKAYGNRDRLPAREALMIEAEYLARRGALPSGIALLREGVRRYPDDPEIWYQLGDAYLHWGPQLKLTPSDAQRALERAVELDPDFVPYHIHLVDLALIEGDSAKAAERLETERRLAGKETLQLRAHQLQFDYLYGSEDDRVRVVEALEDADVVLLSRLRRPWTHDGEKAGEALRLARLACEETRERGDMTSGVVYDCLYIQLASGRIDQAREWISSRVQSPDAIPFGPATLANLVMRQTGLYLHAPSEAEVTVPTLREEHVGVVQPDLVMSALLALDQGRVAVTDSTLVILERQADSAAAAQDTLDARLIHGLVEGIRGYRALSRQREDEALEHLTVSERLLAGSVGPEGAFWTQVVWPLAEIQARRGNEREAIQLYRSLWWSLYSSPAFLRRIDFHDRLGEEARADSLRRHFLHLWADGDSDHPFIQQVRRGLPPG